MAHVTDYDVWHVSEDPVTVERVIEILNRNTALAQEAIRHLARSLPAERPCDCPHALADALITRPEAIPAETRDRLELLVGKYLK
jgi:5'-methylthioadenosine phosphorylase